MSKEKINIPVSVIIPVYNVAPYIEKCARSLFEQSLKDIEFIFVDDCSPDNSSEILHKILDEYPERKNQTKIIKTPTNLGLAGVRKTGILKAKGEYIIHCDSDDWVDLDLYEKMYISAVENDADIVFCDEKFEYTNNSILKPVENLPPSGKELIKNWYKCIYGLYCHNKLVRSSIYKDHNILPWEGLNMWEDNGLFGRLFFFANKITNIKNSYYHYNRANVNALTKGYGIKQVEQMIGIAQNLADFYSSLPDSEHLKKTADTFKYLARINLITDSFKNYNRYKTTFPESNYIKNIVDRRAFSSKGKLRFLLVKSGLAPFFILCFKLYNLVKR